VDYKVILSPASIRSLEQVTAWIAKDDSALAEKTGNGLLDRIAILQRFPLVGSVYAANRKWRKLVSRPYVIIYRVKPSLRVIEVLAFRHSAQEAFEGG
jgi:plasmid stabilization system protein ParE